jgi:hypothetical protein
MGRIELQPTTVLAGKTESSGQLVFWQGSLAAVLVRIAEAEGEGDSPEGWFLEAGFGKCGFVYSPLPSVFPDLESAVDWIERRLEASEERGE